MINGLKNVSLGRLLIPVIATLYLAISLLGRNELLIVLLPFVFGFAPGYEVLAILRKQVDQVETLVLSVMISVVMGTSLLLVGNLFFDDTDLFMAGGLCSVVALILFPVMESRPSNRSEASQGRMMMSKEPMGRRQKALAIALVAIMATATLGGSYLLLIKESEGFTEFYILGEGGSATRVPLNYTVGSGEQIIVGLVNHEGVPVNYTIEVWLVNFTNINMAVNVTEMYFYDRFSVELDPVETELTDPWAKQWETYLELNFSVPGSFYLYFMLFKNEPEELPEPFPMDPLKDYSKTTASWRVVLCVNNQIQYLRMPIAIND